MQAKAVEKTGEMNAKAAEYAAGNAEDEAAEAAHRQRIEKRHALAQINAQAGASGAVMSGSPLMMVGETAKRYELDINDMTRRAKIQAQQYRYEGELARYQAKQQSRSLKLAGYTTILNGAVSFVTQAANFPSSGGAAAAGKGAGSAGGASGGSGGGSGGGGGGA